MALADDLLEQAKHLASREKTRPKQASLRRAVSTAYYALFHLLIDSATKNWRRAVDRPRLGRAFDHSRMKRVCSDTVKASPADELGFVAKTFLELQQKRHTADYDTGSQWTRTETLEQLDRTALAFQNWSAICNTASAQEFLVSMLIKER